MRVRADQDSVGEIARAFVGARRAARGLPAYPGTLPDDLDLAYRIQDAALAEDGRPVAGWKIGRINPPFDSRFGTNRLAGPIFDGTIAHQNGAALPVIAAGFGAAEAEFLLQLGHAPDPARAEWSAEEARALVSAVHIGIEVASSPFPGINDHGPAVTVSDFGNNFGLLVGPALTDWRTRDLDRIAVATRINGETVGAATTATMLDGPWGALRFLLKLMQRRGIALHAGQWVSTGAVTGVHPVRPGDTVEAGFDHQTISCRITAATPNEDQEREHVGSATSGG
jgi:2-keto-4-pentenoate hydratase